MIALPMKLATLHNYDECVRNIDLNKFVCRASNTGIDMVGLYELASGTRAFTMHRGTAVGMSLVYTRLSYQKTCH